MNRYKLRIKEYTQKNNEKYYTVDIMQKYNIFKIEFWIRYWSPYVTENGNTTSLYSYAGVFDTKEQARESGNKAIEKLIKSHENHQNEKVISIKIIE